MFTQTEIRSHCKRETVYAPQGVAVTVITFSHPVYIVEYLGNRFPVHMDKLGEAYTEPEPIEEVKAILPQLSLF